MAYDPNTYQDPYGGYQYGGYDQYDPYGGYQTFDDFPPPEPSKDWEDVPKLNRSYARKIRGNLVQEDFIHLKNENLYVVEAMVEHIELKEELMVKEETKEKVVDEILTSLKVLDILFSDLSVSRDGKRLSISREAIGQSLTSLLTSPPLPKFFQRMFSHAAKIASEWEDKNKDILLEQLLSEEEEIVGEWSDETNSPLNDIQEENLEGETTKRAKIEVMEGKSVLLLMSGVSMIQKLQTHDIRIAVSRRYVTQTGEDQMRSEETILLGSATVRLPQRFQKAVMRGEVTKGSFSTPLVGESGEQVGEVSLSVTLVNLGQGVEVEMSEGPRAYTKVGLIKAFLPEPMENIFDPMVHPRLAVTLMNMEPPLDLDRTSTEILKNYLDSKLMKSESDDGTLSSKYKPRKCRWMELAREVKSKYSKFSLNSQFSDTSHISQRISTAASRLGLKFPGQEVDSELDLLWRKLKLKCREYREETELKRNEVNSLYHELEELLRQDKGEGWKSEGTSERSHKSIEEDRVSKSTRGSTRKSTLKSASQNA